MIETNCRLFGIDLETQKNNFKKAMSLDSDKVNCVSLKI